MTENKAKPKAKSASRVSKPRKSVPKSKDAAEADLKDWREVTLARMRSLILEADPEMIEERKWRKPSNAMVGIPVWSHHGIVCTGETYKQVVKLTFAQGAKIPDPSHLFNSSLEGNTRRAIDIHEGETISASAFKTLIKAAVAHNRPSAEKAKPRAKAAPPVKLLSGGNPQIAKAYGDAPVQTYIAAMPGWKRDVGRRLDALIVQAVPHVHKAVKWNTPFYGIEGEGWFLGFHCITKYIKVSFFRGTSLRPLPPIQSKQKEVRYFHIYEDGQFDEAQFADWVKQASQLPGERM